MSTVRLRRLTADFANLSDYVRKHPRVRLIQSDGDPPERYQLEYRIDSLRMVNEELKRVKCHLVEIFLPRNYPRMPPQCRMLSPVFHPNIAPHAICVGDHWSSGEPLQSIVMRIGELLAYQSYNVKSPLNGEAARWVELNEIRLPLDDVSLLVEGGVSGAETQTVPKPSNAVAPKPEAVASSRAEAKTAVGEQEQALRIACPHCQKTYRIRQALMGRKVTCVACNQSFTVQVDASS